MKKAVSLLISLTFLVGICSVNPLNRPVTVKAEGTTVDLTKDVNGDSSIDLRDVTTLSRYVAGWPNLIFVEENLDCNSDSEVNLKDITYLSRLVAGWDMSPDYTVNNPSYSWPTISAVDKEAGTPFLTTESAPSASGALSKFLLTTDNNPALPFNVACYISGSSVTALIPAGISLNAMKVDFTYSGKQILQGSTEVFSNLTEFDFTKPVTLTLVANNDTKTNITVYVMTLNTGIPSMSITVDQLGAIDSKVDTKGCDIYAGGGNRTTCTYAKKEALAARGAVKGRGWTSWYSYPKKSYTLKFDESQSLFDLPANKDWVLAANYADRSLLRNSVAIQLAYNVGIESIMDMRFVDLWVNGKYDGNYQLLEKVEIGTSRVNITGFDSTKTPDQIGYIIETNGHDKASEFQNYTNGMDVNRPNSWLKPFGTNYTYDPISGDIFYTSSYYGSIFVLNKPSDSKLVPLPDLDGDGYGDGKKYVDYIYTYMNQLEAAIKTKKYSEASKYLDMTAMAKWYIVEELTMNTDSKLHCSCYMYKDAGGKMKMGPVWDFDLGLGNGQYAYTSNAAYLDSATWFKDLLTMPEFKALVKSIWTSSKTAINTSLTTYVDSTSTLLQGSQAQNFKRWGLNDPAEWAYPTALALDSYAKQVNYVKTFMSQRYTYENTKFMGW